jgi:hypothetical protein
MLFLTGRELGMGRSPVQGVLPKYLKGIIVSEVNSESKRDRGVYP